jgi:DNA (cytosine-5)-methyltransferase 1
MKPKKYTYIDLFSGCGGLSLGLHNANWQGLFAIEKSKDAFETLKFNLIDKLKHFKWPKWLPKTPHNIYDVLDNYKSNLIELKDKVTLVAGGPPCQGFSMAGRRNESDERNKLIDAYIDFINYVEPKILLFENVKGFTVGFKKENSRGEAYSKYVIEKLKNLGYGVSGKILDFSEFGIPQRRKRFILIGVKGKTENEVKAFFDLLVEKKAGFLKSKNLESCVTIEDSISDLLKSNGLEDTPDRKRFKSGIYTNAKSNYQVLLRKGIHYRKKIVNSHSFPNHEEETIKKFEYILKNATKDKSVNDEIKSKFELEKRTIVPLDGKKMSPTLTTLPDDYIHYSEPRILTVREYARIQSFPDWFEFKGKYTTGGKLRKEEVPRYTQIGNAIPPLFGEQCGLVLNIIL